MPTAGPLAAAVITVNGFDSSTVEDLICTLREAIDSANQDVAIGGCDAGSGADTIVLEGDVELDLVDSFETGLPRVTTKITVRGAGRTIARSTAAGTPEFRARPGVTTSAELTIEIDPDLTDLDPPWRLERRPRSRSSG